MSAPASPSASSRSVNMATPASSNPGGESLAGSETRRLFSITAGGSYGTEQAVRGASSDQEDSKQISRLLQAAADREEEKTRKKTESLVKMRMMVPESQKFSGDGKKPVRQWIAVVEEMLLKATPDDIDRGFLGKGWLTGTALHTILNEVARRKEMNEPEMGWTVIRKKLIDLFDAGNSMDLAMDQLTTMKMSTGPLSTVAAYNMEWHKQLQYIDSAEWSGTALTRIYINGLLPKIKQQMIQTKHAAKRSGHTAPPNLQHLMMEAVEMEAMVKEMSQAIPQERSVDKTGNRQSTFIPFNRPPNATTARSVPAIKVNHVQEANEETEAHMYEGEELTEEGRPQYAAVIVTPNKPPTTNGKKTNTIFLTQEERSRLMKAGRCFRCYKTGHMKSGCSEPPATQRPDSGYLN